MLHNILRNKLEFENFKPRQQEVVESVMSQQHTLGILPTRSGRNLCYRIPTYLPGKPTLITSPLISLMNGQVMQSKINGERRVTRAHSGVDEIEKKHSIKYLRHNRFIFLNSRFLLRPSGFKLMSMIDSGMIVLDEARCLPEWGYDFGPRYVLIGKVAKHFKGATVLTSTATAPPHLQDGLTEMLTVQFSVIKTTVNRPNIGFKHLDFHDDENEIEWLLPFLQQLRPTITYVSSKKMCLNLAQLTYDSGFFTGIYHGDMNYQERYIVQQQLLNNDIPIIVATNVLGMGINRKDIRTIIHFRLSTSLSSCIQEIGRTGRDSELSQAVSLFQPDDKHILETLLFTNIITEESVQNFEIEEFLAPGKQAILTTLQSFCSIGALKQIFKQSFKRKQLGFFRVVGYCKLDQCGWKYLLELSGEYPPAQDRCCDNDSNITDVAILSKKRVIRSIGFDGKLRNLFLRWYYFTKEKLTSRN